jgi:ferredoxin
MAERAFKTEDLRLALKRGYDLIDVSQAALPIKQYFLPPVETIFAASSRSERPTVPLPERPIALYGVSPVELKALQYLDEIMSSPEKDFYYFRRRERALIVAVLDGEAGNEINASDIIVRNVDNGQCEIKAVSQKGKALLRGLKPSEPKEPEGSAKAVGDVVMPRLKRLLSDAELLKDAVEWSWRGYPRIWERLGHECMGCGICTYVCPLCHCFSVDDFIGLDGKASRCRRWTACTLPEFSLVAGKHYFHPTVKERYYNWFFHKFVRAYAEFGRSQCVACGNCQRECPARIDIEKVIVEIVEAYERRAK